jgi:hypothetical protein
MTDFSNPNSPFNPGRNGETGKGPLQGPKKMGQVAGNAKESGTPNTPNPILEQRLAKKPVDSKQVHPDKLFESLKLAWVTSGQNPELTPATARITQQILHHLPSPQVVDKLFSEVISSLSSEFGMAADSEDTHRIAEDVVADLLIGRPVVAV